MSVGRKSCSGSLALVLVVVLSYLPLVHNGFVMIDDAGYITDNAHVKEGLTWSSVWWAFTATKEGNWHPLTWLSHLADVSLFGLDPVGHHLVNLLFHALNTVLLFALVRGLSGLFWLSWLVAAVFGVHPLHVESVAWAAERKDVLSTFFGFLGLLAYLERVRHPSRWRAATATCLALSLLAKPMLVTFPLILLLLDFWPLGRAHSRPWLALFREKAPLFALASAAALIAYFVQEQAGVVASWSLLPAPIRVGNAVLSYVRYLGKIFWPVRLAIEYPYIESQVTGAKVFGAAALLVAVSAAALVFRRRRPWLVTGWAWYLLSLVPAIGIVQVGNQALADRYTYLPSVGVSIAVLWLLHEWKMAAFRKWLAIAAGALMVAGLAKATWRQTAYWRDTRSLYEHAAAVDAQNYNAWLGLGIIASRERRSADAIGAYGRVLAIKPGHVQAQRNLALTYLGIGNDAEAYRIYLQLRRKDRAAAADLYNYLVGAKRTPPRAADRSGAK